MNSLGTRAHLVGAVAVAAGGGRVVRASAPCQGRGTMLSIGRLVSSVRLSTASVHVYQDTSRLPTRIVATCSLRRYIVQYIEPVVAAKGPMQRLEAGSCYHVTGVPSLIVPAPWLNDLQ